MKSVCPAGTTALPIVVPTLPSSDPTAAADDVMGAAGPTDNAPPLTEASSDGTTEAGAAGVAAPPCCLSDVAACAAAGVDSMEAEATPALPLPAGLAPGAVWDAELGSGDCAIAIAGNSAAGPGVLRGLDPGE